MVEPKYHIDILHIKYQYHIKYLDILQDLGTASLDLATFYAIQDGDAQLSQKEEAAGSSMTQVSSSTTVPWCFLPHPHPSPALGHLQI